MAKFANDLVMDAALDRVATSNKQAVCSAQPTTFYEAVDPNAWVASTPYSLGAAARPTTRNGFVYEVTTAGTSGASEPAWPTTAGSTVVDGTVTWTCRTNYNLAQVAMAGGDFTKANGDTSGRKVTMGQKSSIAIHTTGTATHIVLMGTSTLEYGTTCTSQSLTAGGTVTVPAWDVEIADPS